jgi:peptide/nickel transport system substrate-binding protein
MKRLRWQLLIIFLTGLVVGILLLGEQRPLETSNSPAATPTPIRGGAYTEALVGSLQRLNPLLDRYNQVDRDIDRLIFSGLVRFDARGVPQPDLAAAWGVSVDGTLYNVSMRKNAVWHDGKPVTADDVLFTIDLMRSGGEVVPVDLQEFWKGVEAVKLSDSDIQFRLPESFAPFLDYLTFGVLPNHLLGGKTLADILNDPFNLAPVGSGPYRFNRLIVENDTISGLALSAFKEFYQAPPYIDELVLRYYGDGPAALQAYRDGQVQGIGQVDREILPEVLSESGLALYTAREPKLALVLFNLNNPDVAFLQDKQVRKALLAGINRQRIIDRVLQGQAIQADGPILPGTWAYYDGIKPVEFDPEKAQALLKEAGFIFANEGDAVRSNQDKKLSFSLLYPDTPEHRAIAEAIQAGWSDLGVEVTLEALPYDQLVSERLVDRSYQAALIDLNLSRSPDPDPYPFWDQAQASGSGQNYAQWDNRMASEYLEQARIAVDLNERAKMYRNFQVVFQEELPALPLFYPVYSYAVTREVQDVRTGPFFDPSDRFSNIPEWNLANRPRVPAPAVEASATPQP